MKWRNYLLISRGLSLAAWRRTWGSCECTSAMAYFKWPPVKYLSFLFFFFLYLNAARTESALQPYQSTFLTNMFPSQTPLYATEIAVAACCYGSAKGNGRRLNGTCWPPGSDYHDKNFVELQVTPAHHFFSFTRPMFRMMVMRMKYPMKRKQNNDGLALLDNDSAPRSYTDDLSHSMRTIVLRSQKPMHNN